MDKGKTLTMDNKLEKPTDKKTRFRCGSLEHLHITSKEFTVGIYYQNLKKGLVDGYFSTRGEEDGRRCIRRIKEKLLYAREVIDEG